MCTRCRLADGAWAHKATLEERFIAAAATNARLIRQAITDFRKDVVRGRAAL